MGDTNFDFRLLKIRSPAASHNGKQNEINLGIELTAPNKRMKKTYTDE
jgi:hypothetical protein